MFSMSTRYLLALLLCLLAAVLCQDIIGCGGFVKSEVEINFSLIEVGLYTKQGSLKYQTDCAPNNGYFMIPVYDKGDYVLKVAPPPGWTFEPQSIELHIDGKSDLCSMGEDINFQFTGFGVVGKVVSKAQVVGPSGIELSLKKAGAKEVLKTTTSTADGAYTFEKVLPGEYLVEGAHSKWQFEQVSTAVTVGREATNSAKPITVHGYDVTGEVSSEGDAVEGVNFVLFSSTLKAGDVKGCTQGAPKGFPVDPERSPLCFAVSGQNGRFTFASVPVGAYSLVPFYKGAQITFDVSPAVMEFSVGHDSLVLKEKFQVTGFSVKGKVLSSIDGAGVSGAAVVVEGSFSVAPVTTDAAGAYTLYGVRRGLYRLRVEASRTSFPVTAVSLSPAHPRIPNIIADRFSACGRVIIDKVPSGLERLSAQHKITITGSEVTEVSTNEECRFCVYLKPGKYVFAIDLTDQEVKAGLKLAPAERVVVVTDSPVDGVIFSQFRATVKGSLACLEACGSVQLTLAATGRVDERRMIQAIGGRGAEQTKASFEFNDIMPGKYRVSVLSEEWCWEERSVDIEVVDHDVADVGFRHTGYILSCSISHHITLNYEQSGKAGRVGSFNLTKGVNKLCLSQPGVYTLSPRSCRQFEQQQYKYDTSTPAVLSLSAVRHRAEGRIVTQSQHEDIVLTIKSSMEEQPITLGPLKPTLPAAEDKPAAAAGKEGKKAKAKAKAKKEEEPKGPFTYTFEYWARAGEKLEVTASSKVLLFYPESITATVAGHECPGVVAEMEGRPGVFISGAIQPSLSGVAISISTVEQVVLVTLETDSSGRYKVGPLHSDQQYTVKAEKPGYVMTAVDGKTGDFNAFKLGEILVQVDGEQEEKLSGVLLSLSGGPSNYRSNQITTVDGSMQFIGLSPGQYFLRPMMKEYKFSPASQMIQVEEGTTKNLRIAGTRVAFSCYGSVTSLNGEAEPGVFVEAVGSGDGCDGLEEEGKTEADGSFRIRGLQPDCEYDVRVSGGDSNPHIERTTPVQQRVKVTGSGGDISHINILAFRRMSQMDLSGNVDTDHFHLPFLKVQLYRESEPDAAIHTIKLDSTSFFHLPSLTIDSQAYSLRLVSTLSQTTYTYQLSEITFLANTTYRHFTLHFDPQTRHVEQDLNSSSFLIIPLTALIIFLSYNSTQVKPLAYQLLAFIKAVIQGSNQRPHSRSSSPAPNADLSDISPELLLPTPRHRMRRT